MRVTEIDLPLVVQSNKNRTFEMTDRKNYGISLCINGQITYTMNGKHFISDKNVAILLPKGASYTLLGDKDGLFPIVNFQCQDFTCDEITVIPLRNPKACIELFSAVKQSYLSKEKQLQTFSLFYKFLDEIDTKTTPSQHLLSSAIDHIAKNLSDTTLSNTELATHLGISEVYLRKLFLKQFGITPKQYVLNRRLEKAKTLLTDTTLTVTTISESCGFSNVYHFCRSFKQRTGLTPLQFSKQNRVFQI